MTLTLEMTLEIEFPTLIRDLGQRANIIQSTRRIPFMTSLSNKGHAHRTRV